VQGAQNLRSEAYLQVRCNDEGEAQRRRWTFYETIKIKAAGYSGLDPESSFFLDSRGNDAVYGG